MRPGMNPSLLGLPAAFGLAGASGLNASLPLLIVSGLARAGLVHLTPPFDALQSDVAFFGLLALAAAEFAVDKVPALDSAGHAALLPLAAASGAIVFASQSGAVRGVDPGLQVVIGLLMGGATASVVHVTRAAARPALNLGLLGPVAPFAEDVTSALVALVALLVPGLALAAVVALIAGGVVLLRRRARRWRARAPGPSP
jgi:hypothetical protein